MASLFMVSCDDVEIPGVPVMDPPELASSTPANGATGVAKGDITIILTYNQNVFCPTAGHEKITLTGATITSVSAELSKVTITATGLEEGETYQLVVPADVIQGPTYVGALEHSISFTVAAPLPVVSALCSANPTAEAVKLYNYLAANYRSKVISGAMANVNWNTEEADRVFSITGKYPAMNTFDYVHLYATSPGGWIDYDDISPVKDWADAGGIVSAMWHWNVPKSGGVEVSTQIWPANKVFPLNDWNENVQLTSDPATLFAAVLVGDKIKIHTADVFTGAQGSLKNSSWAEIASGYEYFDISGDYEMPVTAAILTELQSGGLIIGGHGYTVTGVTLESGGASTILWGAMPFDVGGWGALQLTDGSLFADATVGAKIKVTTANLQSDAQGSLKTGSSGWPAIADGTEYFNIADDYELVITDDILTALQSTGLIISGQNYTITGIYLVSGGTSSDYAFYKDDTSFDAANATITDTWENDVFTADLAKVAASLKQLQDENIAVIWRPFHEAAGGWFWWGKDAESFKSLWIAMFDYFQAEGVNNLIWVWTTETGDDDWYPGDEYVDIIGRDLYDKDANATYEEYATIDATYPDRIISLSECGTVGLISDQWAAGARWSWFMPWYGNTDDDTPHGADEWWTNAMSQDFVITRGDINL